MTDSLNSSSVAGTQAGGQPDTGASGNGTSAAQTSGLRRMASGDLGLIPVILALFVIWIVFESINTHFLSGRNISNLILQIVEIGMLGIGETFILLLGEIDLSIAAVSGVAAAILVLLSSAGVNPILAILISILGGALIGLFQGLWVTVVGVPAFIVTLAGSLAYQGVLLAMLGQTGTVPIMNHTLLAIATTYISGWGSWLVAAIGLVIYLWAAFLNRSARQKFGLHAPSMGAVGLRGLGLAVVSALVVYALNSYHGLPFAGVVLLIFVLVFAFITQSTRFGRHVYALGGNGEAARRAGINIKGIRIAVFTMAGAFGAIGGIVGASRLGSASPASGTGNLLLDSIAAAVIGGTSLFGGRGSVWNAFAGALVIGSVENGMDLLSAPSSTKYLVEGGILLIAVTIDTLTRRRRNKLGR
jgi:D-xylose transport system permease protein